MCPYCRTARHLTLATGPDILSVSILIKHIVYLSLRNTESSSLELFYTWNHSKEINYPFSTFSYRGMSGNIGSSSSSKKNCILRLLNICAYRRTSKPMLFMKSINRSGWTGRVSWIKSKQNVKRQLFPRFILGRQPKTVKLDPPHHSQLAHIHTHRICWTHRHNYQVLQGQHVFPAPTHSIQPAVNFRFWSSMSSALVAVSPCMSSFILHSISLSAGCFFFYLFWSWGASSPLCWFNNKEFCVLHVQSKTTIFHLLVQ